MDFPGGLVVKNPPANAGDKRLGLDPWVGKIPGGGNGNPLWYSCLINPTDKGAWQASLKVKSLSCVRLFVTPWTVAYQASPSMGFSKQEYWSGLPFPSPRQASLEGHKELDMI